MDLAKLARIELENEEAESLSHEFDAILKYVGEVKKLDKSNKFDKLSKVEPRNVMREDVNPHESGIFTQKLLEQTPAREGDYIKVKKIL